MIPTSGSRAAHGPATLALRMTPHIMLVEVEVVIAYVLQALRAASCLTLHISITFLTSSTTIVFNGSEFAQAEFNFCLFVCTKHFSDSLGHQENVISVLGFRTGTVLRVGLTKHRTRTH